MSVLGIRIQNRVEEKKDINNEIKALFDESIK
jgi:hypothetical protein